MDTVQTTSQSTQPPSDQNQVPNEIANFINLANPLVSNILQNPDLNMPIADLIDEEIPESLYEQITSQLSMMDMLALF